MKLSLLMGTSVLALTMALTSCGSDTDASAPTPSTTETQSTSEPSASPETEDEVSSPTASASPSPPTYLDITGGKLSSAESCAAYEEFLTRFQEITKKRQSSLKGKSGDPYDAAKFARRNPWVFEDLSVSFEAEKSAEAVRALNELSDGQAGSVDDSLDFLEASLQECGLSDSYAEVAKAVKNVDTMQTSVVTSADNKPWYPKGYVEYQNVAFKWTDESCGSNYGYCWTMRVVSEDGCYGGLYAEVNISQNDVIVGYSNDSLGSLPAGDVGRLEFTYYGGSGIKSAQLTELNCY